MSKIAVLIDELFEDNEYKKPAEAFKDAGHKLVIIGLEKGKNISGKNNEESVIIDSSIKDTTASSFDALFIPGGYSPDRLRAHDEAVALVKDFADSNKPIFFICHGVQLLINADVLKGRNVTCWKSVTQDVKNAGAHYLDQEVVIDKNFVSSRHPGDIPAFIEASLKKLN